MKKLYTLLVIITLFLISGCHNKSTQADATDFTALVTTWDKAHSAHSTDAFSELYADTVMFYGTTKSKDNCAEAKSEYLKDHPDYFQQIKGNIQTEKISDNEVKCTFVKSITLNQETKDYPEYLVFKKKGDKWKITVEGDLVTDKNIANRKKVKIPKNAVKGDFNGDGTTDYAWLIAPKTVDGPDCVGDCTSYIKFSDATIPTIKVESCIGGVPDNLGDLNDDGSDEIGLYPDWFSSCWRGYYVWTLKNGKWIEAVDPIYTHCTQWEKGVFPIEKDVHHPGFVIIHYSELTDDDLIIKSKSVKIK